MNELVETSADRLDPKTANGESVDQRENAGECMMEECTDEELQEDNTEMTPTSSPKSLPAHFRNKQLHVGWRYGIPLFLLAALSLLLAADISSGVTAKTILIFDGEVDSVNEILTVSIFTSVSKLWETGSYALALFVCVTSVTWPYLKLLLSLAAWMLPFKDIKKRERMIEILDVLDKWSFVDIFVLTIIMVAFRATINVGQGVEVEVLIIPKWGFYGFVFANMMSLWATQIILYLHRQLQYHSDEKAEESQGQDKVSLASQTKLSFPLIAVLLVVSTVLHVVGCVLDIFEFENSRGELVITDAYSVLSIGMKIPLSVLNPNIFGIRWIQAMYFLFAVILPVWNNILFGVLFLYPMRQSVKEKIFFLSEITFSWLALEVFVVSVIFAILQIPKFGNALVDSGCETCYKVHSRLKPEFAVIGISALLCTLSTLFLFFRAHKTIYKH